MIDSKSRYDGRCPAIEAPLLTFARLIREKVLVCRRLEAIADDLPNRVDADQCAIIAGQLPALLQLCDDINHRLIFPLLVRHASATYFTSATAQRLIKERMMDQGYALEVSELLDRLAKSETISNADASGYLLRGFFVTVRRSGAFDLEYVLPMARRHLTDQELADLAVMLKGQCHVMALPCSLTRQKLTSRVLH